MHGATNYPAIGTSLINLNSLSKTIVLCIWAISVKRDPAERYKIAYINLKSRLTLNDQDDRDLAARHDKLKVALHADYAHAFASHKELTKLIANKKKELRHP
jgi:hypothetical protein